MTDDSHTFNAGDAVLCDRRGQTLPGIVQGRMPGGLYRVAILNGRGTMLPLAAKRLAPCPYCARDESCALHQS